MTSYFPLSLRTKQNTTQPTSKTAELRIDGLCSFRHTALESQTGTVNRHGTVGTPVYQQFCDGIVRIHISTNPFNVPIIPKQLSEMTAIKSRTMRWMVTLIDGIPFSDV